MLQESKLREIQVGLTIVDNMFPEGHPHRAQKLGEWTRKHFQDLDSMLRLLLSMNPVPRGFKLIAVKDHEALVDSLEYSSAHGQLPTRLKEAWMAFDFVDLSPETPLEEEEKEAGTEGEGGQELPAGPDPADVLVETISDPNDNREFFRRPPTGVRLTHKPTGIVGASFSTRSVMQNRVEAWAELVRQFRLYQAGNARPPEPPEPTNPGAASKEELQEMVRWAYSKLHNRQFNDQDDALMLDRMKLFLESGI